MTLKKRRELVVGQEINYQIVREAFAHLHDWHHSIQRYIVYQLFSYTGKLSTNLDQDAGYVKMSMNVRRGLP